MKTVIPANANTVIPAQANAVIPAQANAVIPAKAGIQGVQDSSCALFWVPAYAGMAKGAGMTKGAPG